MFTRQLSFSGCAALVVAGWTVLVGGCVDAGPEQRVLTRGAISGRVVLVDIPGLNDLSRVRVDFGNGEGGVAVADDGLFAVTDLEPDVYALTVTYIGGLTPEANGSAYQAFSRRVPLGVGAAVDVGDLVLQPATGSVTGHVGFNDADGAVLADVADTVVRLLMDDGGALETTLSADGGFAFEDVPVGFHVVQVDRDGFAIPPSSVPAAGQTETCGAPAAVVQADAVADVGILQLVQARAALLPGEGEVVDAGASTWVLSPGGERISVQVVSAAARRARVWLDDTQSPPTFSEDGGLSFAIDVPPGAHRVLVQTTDGCRFTSPTLTKNIVRDNEPPQVLDLFIAGARENGDGVAVVGGNDAAVIVVVEADDLLSGVDEMALALVASDQDPATIDVQELTFEPVGADGAARVTRSLVLPDNDGTWRVVAFARDGAGNVSLPTGRIDDASVFGFLLDRTPPRIDGIVIGDGAPVTRDTTPSVRLTVFDDGSGPQTVSVTVSGVFDRQALPFQPTFIVALPGEDGDKTVTVRVEDGAGNASVAHVDVQLDRTPPRGTLARVGGGTVLAATGPVELLIGHDADVVAVGIGTEEDACGGATPTAPDGASSTRRVVNIPGPDGLVVVRACLRDAAGNQSALTQTFTVDTTPPAATLTLAGGRAFSTSPLVDVIVSSSEQPVQLRFDEAAGSTPPPPSEACAGDAGYAPFRATDRVLLGGEGRRVVWVCLRDAAGLSALASATITVDTVAPVLRSVTIGDGQATQRATSSLVRLDGEGAEFMRVGVDRSAELAPLVPFSPDVPVTFGAVDGLHTVQVVLQDEAGNRSASQSAEVTLVTRGSLAGTVSLEDGGDPTALEAVLVGTTLQASVDTTGAFRFVDVAQGQYVVRVRAAAAGTAPIVVDDRVVAVVAGEQVNAGTFVVRAAKGSVVGTVTRELATDHTGIAIELVGTTQTTSTTSAGVFELRAVPAGLYDVRLSAPGFVPVVVPAVQVRQDAQTVLDARQLTIVRGVLLGTASRDDDATLGRDSGGLSVALFGNGTTATTVTDASGAFRFDGVLPGSYSVEVSSDGYEPRRENGLAVAGGVDNAAGNFVVTRKRGDVQGVVAIEGQTVFSGVRVALLDSPLVTFTDATGRYSFRAPVGNYGGVRASLPFFRAETVQKTVTVTDQGTFTVDAMTLRGESGLIAGRILLADPFPDGHGGTTVTLTGFAATATDGIVARTITDATGAFAFDEAGSFVVDSAGVHPLAGSVFAFAGVPVGRYRITAVPRVDANASATGQRQTLTEPNLVVVAGEVTPWNVTSNTLFVLVNQGAVLANNRLVRLDLGATNCFRMKLRVDAEPDGATAAQPCSTPVLNFDLGTTQGERRVFGEFTDGNGILIGKANDSIKLDSLTQIVSFTHGVTQKLDFGARVTFTARTGEPRGRAVVAIEGYDTGIVLAEGGAGCTAGEVGCYGLQYQLLKRIDIKPNSPTQLSGPGTTTVSFTDEAGNVASARAATALEVAIPPVISAIQVIPDLFSQTAVVKFTTDEVATGIVRPGQFENSLCTSGCPTTALGTTHQVTITGAQAGEPGGVFLRNKAYFVRVDATDAKGNLNGSAVLRFFLQPDAPKMVVPIPMDSRVLVRWEAPPQEDLSGYFVERSENSGAFIRISGATPYNHEVLTFDDRTVVNGRQYTYRVRAVDFFGNASDPATTTDMAKNADGTFDATKLAAFSACGTVTPAVATSTAGTDIAGGVLPLCTVWTKAGSPFRVNASIAVANGGVFVVGPGSVMTMTSGVRIISRGRFVFLGERGSVFDVRSNSFPAESEVGAIAINGSWHGFEINPDSLHAVKSGFLGYRGGNLVYRAKAAACFPCISGSVDSLVSIVRSSLLGAQNNGDRISLLGSELNFMLGNSQIADSVIEERPDSFLGQTLNGVIDGFSRPAYFSESSGISDPFIRAVSSEVFPPRAAPERRVDVYQGTVVTSAIFGGGGGLGPGSPSTSVLGANTYSSVVFARLPMLAGSEIVKSSDVWGTARLMETTNIEGWSKVNILSARCALRGGIESLQSSGSSARFSSLVLDCATASEGNFDRVTDFNDDVSRGTVLLLANQNNSFPRARVNGAQIVSVNALRRGVNLVVLGDDLEDGRLPESAGFWTDSSGARVGDGPTLHVPGNLQAGTTIFTAHVRDSDGLDADLPWPLEVRNDASLADNWMWPDSNRWRVAALHVDQLPPQTNATSVATFRWRCFTPGCTTTCSIDPNPNADVTAVATAPCRSPVEVAGLAPGSHTFVVQPRDAAGNVIDLPQRYTWNVVAPTADPTTGAAAPTVDLIPGTEGVVDVTMTTVDTPNQVVTCSVDGRHERSCGSGLSISGIGVNGLPAQELTIRVRDRANGMELQPSRAIHLNDPDDIDGDGWIDRDANGNVVDPCLSGAERVCASP